MTEHDVEEQSMTGMTTPEDDTSKKLKEKKKFDERPLSLGRSRRDSPVEETSEKGLECKKCNLRFVYLILVAQYNHETV